MDKNYNVVGYVKLAKLWERSENSAIEYHHNYYQNKFANYSNYNLHDVYIDITGKKETYKRMEMVRLLKDCQFGYVDIIFTQMTHRIDIITEDDSYNINTLVNDDNQREALLKMADDCIYLNPLDFQEWMNELVRSINSLGND